MNKEEILMASRHENKNKDLVELEAGHLSERYASRAGALMCCAVCLLSSILAKKMLYGPWTIYFCMVTTQWFVRFAKLGRKSDLALSMLFLVLTILALTGLIARLSGASV
ncbi:DUF6442 family protein [uncultured Dubosiella sp.]|uniref:DUF6442 family protein n=1 Tax=uncultured Dubosiella sp. TaxID=1937011 RepID=UPI002618C6D7|nr:DUF6442 family protein [uncultured Dubosiella sp.]